jgi:hypothetical protein
MSAAKCLLPLAALLSAEGATVDSIGACVDKVWQLDVQGDTLALEVNLFPEIDAQFPTRWLRWQKRVSGGDPRTSD